jgi:uncharacterized protein
MNLEAFLLDVLTPMLDHPEALRVEVKEEGRRRDVLIHAETRDRGRVIGKSGRMISSLRTLVKAAGEKHGLIVNLELFDEEARPARAGAHAEAPAAPEAAAPAAPEAAAPVAVEAD